MPKEVPEWKKQLLENEPDEEWPSLDPEALAPHKEKIKTVEKELAVLENFLKSHFDTETKPQRPDFVELFRNLDTVASPDFDSIAVALSDDYLERKLVYMIHRLQYQPPVMGEILNELGAKGKDEPLELIFEYVKTLYLGIVENKKKVLWQLAKHIGIKKSAAIFQEQDNMKERLFPEFVARLDQKNKQWFESGKHEAIRAVRQGFDFWYEENKERFELNREIIHGKVEELSKELDIKNAYEILEKHLSMTPKEIFELMEN